MSQRNRSLQDRRPSLPRSRPSIHRSLDNLDKCDSQELLTTSKDQSTILTTPESSFNPAEVTGDEQDSELRKTSNTEHEEDEENSEISNCTDTEDSVASSKDECEVYRTSFAKESSPLLYPRSRFNNENRKIPLYIPESARYDEEAPDVRCMWQRDQTNKSTLSDKFNLYYKSKPSVFAILLGIFLLVIFLTSIIFSSSEEIFDINLIKENFTTQDEDLWLAFESGVQDVVNMSRPSTFILLYKKEAEDTLRSLLYQLSKYAVCNITDCSQDPIELTGAELNSIEIISDYGILIENYKDSLREKGVMIVKNLERVPGISAQAFHFFCDEFTPLVDKSLFIFTMKVDKLPSSEDRMKFVEEYFRNKWTDIKIDIFNALITRITSMVVEIRA